MTVARDLLHNLLPTVYRTRDAERGDASGQPLQQYLALLTDEIAVLDENLAQLYDDLFVETAAPWALPYLADLIGLRGLPSEPLGLTLRAEVANTIGYRRRKGTAAVLEQLARDVSGWPARAVEFFELLVGTQYVNHVRPQNPGTVDVRPAGRLEFIGTGFERLEGESDLTHIVDVRRIASRRGRYNIPNVGIFLWRLRPYSQTQSPAVPAAAGDKRRFLLSPLGRNTPLFTLPISEDDISHLATPANVPYPISRRMLARDVSQTVEDHKKLIASESLYYGTHVSGADPSILIEQRTLAGDVIPVDVEAIVVCDLSDGAGGWQHTPPPANTVALDPVLGRVAFPADQLAPPLVSFHYGFSADIGGGEYDRIGSFAILGAPRVEVSQLTPAAPLTTITDGLTALDGLLGALDPAQPKQGVVEIADGGRYEETPAPAATSRRIEIRASDKHRPTLVLDNDLVINGDDAGEVILSGLLIIGGSVRVSRLRVLRLRHCTLVPGLNLDVDGNPPDPRAPSLIIESGDTAVEIDSCILGGLRVHREAVIAIRNSIVDAGRDGVAYSALSAADAGGALTLENCTVLGAVHARVIALATNTIFLADAADAPVRAERRQEGCIRFSYLPAGSRTPRRHHCQPSNDGDAARLQPVLTSTRYGDPGYCQLDQRTPVEIRAGADDESEMGVFHDLFQTQREDYLTRRLNEYLRFGLEVGLFFAT